MTIHGVIQNRLYKKYKKLGYDVSIESSVMKSKGYYVVDLIAKNKDETIAIEIGNCFNSKLEFLKTKFDRVIHIPYLEKLGKGKLRHNFCGNTWETRVTNPKSCPKCKRYF